MTECIECSLNGEYFKPSLRLSLNSPITNDVAVFDEVDNIDYHFEEARLESFKNWTSEYTATGKLAAAGFYYIGEGDTVRCFECSVEISQWLPDDNPMVDHQRWSGKCRFIRNVPCGNVPIGVDPSVIPPYVARGRDVCGPYGVEYCPNAASDDNIRIQDTVTVNLAGHADSINPTHPQYANYDDRLRTFETWPRCMAQTKEQLATAGFYYTGKDDQTLCYYCGGGLKDWDPEDDPWEQHAKWFSKCCYLLMVQGQEYVNKINGKSTSRKETCDQSVTGKDEKPDDESCSGLNSQNSIGSQDSGFESAHNATSFEFSEEQSSSTMKLQNNLHNKPIDDARMCKICYNRELRKVFVPCGHLVACAECAKNMKTCAVCRKPVIDTVQAIIS